MKNRIPFYIVYFFGFVLGFMSKNFWSVWVGLASYVIFDYSFIYIMPRILKYISKDLKKHGN